MNYILATSLCALSFLQSSGEPKVWRILIFSPYSNEIALEYAWQVMPENEPLKRGAVECFISRLKATGLVTDVKVDVKRRKDEKGVDIHITPTWYKRRENFVISEIEFDKFEGFDLAKLREALYKKGLHTGISLGQFSLWEIGNMVDEAASEIYASDEPMKKRIVDLDIGHPRYYLQVVNLNKVKLTISLDAQYPCTP